MDKVDIILNGTSVAPYVKSYNLRYDLFGSTGTMNAEIYPLANFSLMNTMRNGGLSYQVNINDKPMQKGWVDKVEKQYSKDNVSLRISGRDMAQVLTDNNILYPRDYLNYTIKQIINSVWLENCMVTGPKKAYYYTATPEPFVAHTDENGMIDAITKAMPTGIAQSILTQNKIKVTVPNVALYNIDLKYTPKVSQMLDTFGKIPKYRTTYGQTLFDVVTDLINPMGILIYNIPGTDTIVFTRAVNPSESLVASAFDGGIKYEFYVDFVSKQGNNVLRANAKTDVSSYYKYVKIIGQSEDEVESRQIESEGGTWLTIKHSMIYEQLESGNTATGFKGQTKFKTAELTLPSWTMWQKYSQYMVNNQILQQNRSLFNLQYTVQGHVNRASKEIYKINEIATVYDDQIGLTNTNMLIYSVEFNGSKDTGMTTTVELCLPSTLDDTIITNAPTISMGVEQQIKEQEITRAQEEANMKVQMALDEIAFRKVQ